MVTHKLYDRSGSEFEINSIKAGDQTAPSMSWVSADRYVLVWSHNDGAGTIDVRAQLFTAAGARIGDEFTVNATTAGAQQNAVVAQLAGGGFVVAWEDVGDTDGSWTAIRYQRFDSNGQKLGSEETANTTSSTYHDAPAIAGLEDGGFVITWTDRTFVDVSDLNPAEIRARVFDSTGSGLGGDFIVNTITLNRQELSSVTALAGGGFAVVWQDGSPQGVPISSGGSRYDSGTDIAIQIFGSAANKVGSQQVVDDMNPGPWFSTSPPGFVTAADPAITTLADGRLAVVWTDLDGLVKTRILAADGSPFSEVRISGGRAVLTSSPSITALSDGGYAVSWTVQSFGPADGSGTSVRTAVHDSTGMRQGAEFVANATVDGAQGGSAMLGLPGGGFTMAWQDASSGSTGTDIRAQNFTPDDGAITDLAFSAESISQTAPENIQVGRLSATGALNGLFSFEIVSDPTGGALRIEGDRLVVADTLRLSSVEGDSLALTLRATDAAGHSWTETVTVALARPEAGQLYVAKPQVLAVTDEGYFATQPPEFFNLEGGRVLMAWAAAKQGSSTTHDLIGQLYDGEATPIGSPFVMNTALADIQVQPQVAALPGGGFVATWTSFAGDGARDQGARAQIFDVHGAKVGAEFAVNTTTTGSQGGPQVIAFEDGSFFIAFTSTQGISGGAAGGDVFGQFFTAAGVKSGAELVINSTTQSGQFNPNLVLLSSGKILVSWVDASKTGGDTSEYAVRATLLNGDGTVARPEFLVNTTTAQHQLGPNATALAGGGFVIVWRDTSEDPLSTLGSYTPSDIYAQIFDSDGLPVGGEFRVNQDTFAGQQEPIVRADPDGGFTVSWSSMSLFEGDGDDSRSTLSVKARSYGSAGNAENNEFLVNQIGAGQQSAPSLAYLSSGNILFAWWDFQKAAADGGSIAQISGRLLHRVGEVVNGDSSANLVAGGALDDVLDGGGGDDSLTGNAGNDVLRGGSGADSLAGGTGDDLYVIDAGDTVTELTGEGTDEIRTALGSATDYAQMYTLAPHVENLTGTSAAGQGVYGNALDNHIKMGGGNDLVVLDAGGNDRVEAGAGADYLYFGGSFTNADSVDGGAGSDTVGLVGNYSIAFDADDLVSVEKLAVYSSGDSAAPAGYTLTTNDLNVAAGQTMTIIAQSLQANELLAFNGSAETNGSFNVKGGRGADTITGGNGADVIWGNLGADTLRGGAGNDSFVYQSAAESTAAARDLILDFAQGDRVA
ncbi:MAG TPA: hypothetical protein VGB62_03100, partial [Allosphingosinicella sp.]